MGDRGSLGHPRSGTKVETYNGFNWTFIQRLAKLHRFLFPSWASATLILIVILLIVRGVEEYIGYHVGLISSAYYQILGDKDFDAFVKQTFISLGMILLISVVITLRIWLLEMIVVAARRQLTGAVQKLYLQNKNFYWVNVLGRGYVDNSDQRITADIGTFCMTYAYVMSDLIIAPFIIAYYAYDAITRAGWVGPTGMFLFFVIATIVNKFLMSPIMNMTSEQEKKEGDFRYKHATLRLHSELLAFQSDTTVEMRKTKEKLFELCRVQRRLYNMQTFLNLFKTCFSYIGSIASYLVIAIPIFGGFYDYLDGTDLSALISENSFVCMNLIYQFSKLVNMTPAVSAMGGATHRIGELLEIFDTSSSDESKEHGTTAIDLPRPGLAFKLSHVTVTAPGLDRSLIQDLDLDIVLGQNLLITGPSSCGKSSLLRAIRGLWNVPQGSIWTNPNISVMFMPQKTFVTNGSLKDQVLYPLDAELVALTIEQESTIIDMFKYLDMFHIFERCGHSLDYDPDWNWFDVLSPGELQRLAFIRLFHHSPSVAFLDESTSALSLAMERKLYEKCSELAITCVSVGHRKTLNEYHQKILRISGLAEDGDRGNDNNVRWTIQNVPK